MRFTDSELGLLKSLFAGNDELLYAVRKAMLQGELNDQEKEALAGAINEQSYAVLCKVFLPHLDPDAPLFQIADLLLGLGSEIKGLSPEGAWPFIVAKRTEIDYISQQLKVLYGSNEKPKIILADLGNLEGAKTSRETVYSNVLARNYLLSYIDSNCQQIKFLAGQKDETVEQTKERLAKDSSK